MSETSNEMGESARDQAKTVSMTFTFDAGMYERAQSNWRKRGRDLDSDLRDYAQEYLTDASMNNDREEDTVVHTPEELRFHMESIIEAARHA